MQTTKKGAERSATKKGEPNTHNFGDFGGAKKRESVNRSAKKGRLALNILNIQPLKKGEPRSSTARWPQHRTGATQRNYLCNISESEISAPEFVFAASPHLTKLPLQRGR